SVSTTPEREDEAHTHSVAEPNLRTIRALQRFVISSESSHYSGTHVVKAEVDSFVMSSPVEPSLFGAGSSLAGGADLTSCGFSDLTGSEFLIGGIRTVIDPNSDLLKVYVP
nr:hypothetical protein [Tanacetum cinerariifolium]